MTAPQVEVLPSALKRRGILTDTATVSGFAILAKILGAAKAIAIAHVFGSGEALDAYLLAFLIPAFLSDVFCGSLLPVLVPTLMELEHREGRARVLDFYAHTLRRSVILASAAGLVLAAFAVLVLVLAGPLTPTQRLTAILVALMSPILPLTAATSVWRAVLNAKHNFTLPALSAMLAPVVVVTAVLMGGSGGVWVLAAATVCAYGVEVFVLGTGLRATGFAILPNRGVSHIPVRHLRREYSFLVATAAISAGGFFVGQAMASTLEAGSLSILNYGTRLSAVFLAIGPAALGVTILPHFSQFAAEREWGAFKDSLVRVLLGWTTFSALACVFLVLFSTPIVRLALQRGAFTAEDTSAVAAVQVCALLQVPFVVGITILMRVLAALKSNRVLLSASSVTLLVNVILNFVLMKRYGVPGIALAASVSQALLWMVLVAVVFRQRGWGILTNNR